MPRRLLPLLLFALWTSMQAQEPAKPPALHFDTVSIREGQRNADGSMTMSGATDDPHFGRLNLNNWSVDNIITLAFGIEYYQLEGVPAYFRRSFYVVRAESGEEAVAALKQMTKGEARAAQRQMVQDVLAERFHLKNHFVTRDAPSYLLTAGKLKLQPSAVKPLVAGDGRKRDDSDPTQPSMSERCESHGCELTARGQSMAWLAGMLDGQQGGRVTDRTNLPGLWDFTLKWTPRTDPAAAGDDTWPRLEDALADQLGLKMERGKAPMQILVVDHLEAPTPN